MKELEVLYENNDVIAINKPAGLLSVPDRFDLEILNVKHILQRDGAERLIVHRLDKDTSGVMLLAKNESSHKHLQNQFEERTIQKEYLAIVNGKPHVDEGCVDQPIVAHAHLKGRMVAHKKGKHALSNWACEERYKYHSLFRIRPTTGRTHQIRVHLAHISHSIVADRLYGDGKPLFLSSFKRNYNRNSSSIERPLISRTALHAYKIEFQDFNNKLVSVECPIPKDMRASINQLRKNS